MAGRPEQFDEVVETCRPRIYRAACLLLDSACDAEDVTQQVFVQAWHGWGRFRGESEAFTWLYRILLRICARHRRRWWWRKVLPFAGHESQQALANLADNVAGPDGHAAAGDDGCAVRLLLAKLTPKLREILVLRYLEDYSVGDIARALRIPEGTVKSRINYALGVARDIWCAEQAHE
ncbi:MAG: sigma-70 family RNA polymerase sigma factor [Kiritimatiellae bacterium]|nr:sigma-70 family RNA polymerase sigma factor [Kiritimatiellia bacterium]